LATAPSGLKVQHANQAVQDVGNAMTYQPRTATGQALSGAADYALSLPAKAGDYVANLVAGDNAAANPPRKYLGAVVDTLVHAIPSVLGAKYAGPEAAPSPAAATVGAMARAKAFVQGRTSLDWNSLSSSVRQRLTDIAQDADTLGQLDPVAVERQAR